MSLIAGHLRDNWQLWFGEQELAELVADTERRVAAAIEDWELEEVEPVGDGQVAVVLGCRYRGEAAVLKVTPRRRDQVHRRDEIEALRLWSGLAPKVLAVRDDGWTALLERLRPGIPLAFCRPRLEALRILGDVERELHCHPSAA